MSDLFKVDEQRSSWVSNMQVKLVVIALNEIRDELQTLNKSVRELLEEP